MHLPIWRRYGSTSNLDPSNLWKTHPNKLSSIILILLFINLRDSTVALLIWPLSSTSSPASTTSMWVKYGTGISEIRMEMHKWDAKI